MSPLIRLIAPCCLLVALRAHGADCELPPFESLPQDHPQCLFYTGTSSYRDANYETAFAQWERLRTLPAVDPPFEDLRTDVYNNLGYLYFKGWGIRRDLKTAIAYWRHASSLGHHEAPYHLCHVYADPDEQIYRPSVALRYCKRSLRRIEVRPDLHEAFESTRTDLERIIARLEKR